MTVELDDIFIPIIGGFAYLSLFLLLMLAWSLPSFFVVLYGARLASDWLHDRRPREPEPKQADEPPPWFQPSDDR